MKTLATMIVLVFLVGCASPYYPVYINDEGDYYVAERATDAAYYGTGSMVFADIGLYPWWINGYSPPVFVYHSPYFYPYAFSIWYPHIYPYYYDRYHYPHWGRGYTQRKPSEQPGKHGISESPAMTRSASAYSRPQPRPTSPSRQIGSSRSTGFSRPSIRSDSAPRSPKNSSPARSLNKD